MPFSLEVAAKSDVGRVRTNNEDNFAYDLRYGVFVVCDGMGGQAYGEVASKIAVQAVLDMFRSPAHNPALASTRAEYLAAAVVSANASVRAAEKEQADRAGMGTTIVTLRIDSGVAAVAHVGDSRAYLWRGGTLKPLTEDHSLVAEQMRRGLITAEQAESSSWQNVLLRALGAADEIEVDIGELECAEGDVFLLATDGLTKSVANAEIARIIAGSGTIASACEQLIRAANDAGGDDNATCMLVRLSAHAASSPQILFEGPI